MNSQNEIKKVVLGDRGRIKSTQLFLREKYFENLIKKKLTNLRPYSSGFFDIEYDFSEFHLGTIILTKGAGILPDGTPFSFPDNDLAPPPLTLVKKHFRQSNEITIYLGLPFNQNENSLELYFHTERFVKIKMEQPDQSHVVAVPKFVLLTDMDNHQNYTSLPIAKIQKSETDDVLDTVPFFEPPMLNFLENEVLEGITNKIHELVKEKLNELNKMYVSLNRQTDLTSPHTIDALTLQLLNRVDGFLKYILKNHSIHPYNFYCRMVQLSSELATYTTKNHLGLTYLPYNHLNFKENYIEIFMKFKELLDKCVTRDAIEIPLKRNENGTFHGIFKEHHKLENIIPIIGVTANVFMESLINYLPKQSKVCASSQIDQHIISFSAGIRLEHLEELPPSIPYDVGTIYFQLLRSVYCEELWAKILQERTIAFHITGDYPELSLRFWLVNENKL